METKKRQLTNWAALLFAIGVLAVVAKPFLGFSALRSLNPPTRKSIFVKAFTKRKQEYTKGSSSDINAIQQKLADPVQQLFLRIEVLLAIVFPFICSGGININWRFLRAIQLSTTRPKHSYLLNGTLII